MYQIFNGAEAYPLQVLRGHLEFEVVVDKAGRGLKIEKALRIGSGLAVE